MGTSIEVGKMYELLIRMVSCVTSDSHFIAHVHYIQIVGVGKERRTNMGPR